LLELRDARLQRRYVVASLSTLDLFFKWGRIKAGGLDDEQSLLWGETFF
jgi:hypothetical protein